MSRWTSAFLVRAIELLLIVALWDTYESCHGFNELCAHFADQTKLAQVGTITALAIILNTLIEAAHEFIKMVVSPVIRVTKIVDATVRRNLGPK